MPSVDAPVPGSGSTNNSSPTSGLSGDTVSEVRGQRLAGLEEHLERPDEPLAIPRLDALGRCRVDAGAPSGGAAPRHACGHDLQPCAQRGVLARAGKQSARQRAKVEAGAADQDRHAAACVDVVDCARRIAGKVRRGVLRLGRSAMSIR